MTKPGHISGVLIFLFVIGWSIFYLVQRRENQGIATNDYDAIRKEGVLRVCGEYDPFSFYTNQSGQHGFHYELVQAFATSHHLKLVYLYEGNFENRLKWIQTGKCDLLTGPLPVITPLKERISYTRPIFTSRLVLIQRASKNPIRNQVDLAGKWLIVPAFSPNTHRISHLATEISDSIYIKPVRVFTNEDLIHLVETGKEDFAVMDERVAKAFKKNHPLVDCSTPLSLPQFQAWAVRHNAPDLLDSLNVFIERYKKSPAFTRLLEND